jgi:hypothetical protein
LIINGDSVCPKEYISGNRQRFSARYFEKTGKNPGEGPYYFLYDAPVKQQTGKRRKKDYGWKHLKKKNIPIGIGIHKPTQQELTPRFGEIQNLHKDVTGKFKS